jgi:hypothetical protein
MLRNLGRHLEFYSTTKLNGLGYSIELREGITKVNNEILI